MPLGHPNLHQARPDYLTVSDDSTPHQSTDRLPPHTKKVALSLCTFALVVGVTLFAAEARPLRQPTSTSLYHLSTTSKTTLQPSTTRPRANTQPARTPLGAPTSQHALGSKKARSLRPSATAIPASASHLQSTQLEASNVVVPTSEEVLVAMPEQDWVLAGGSGSRSNGLGSVAVLILLSVGMAVGALAMSARLWMMGRNVRDIHQIEAVPYARMSMFATEGVEDIAEEEGLSRRGLLQIAGGALVTGIVGNGFAVQGPTPFAPAADSQQNKLVVITGGNTGLGLESAKRLAAAGATIVLTSRNVDKGLRAVQSVKDYVLQETGKASENIYTLPLDLCDLESVKAFPESLKSSEAFKKSQGVDVLVNNAGVMAVPDLRITKDGYEQTFQTNHLGHFALTAGIEPLLNPDGSRVVNVSSMAYLIAAKGLDMENLNGEVEYQPWDAYGRSKLENILFTKELQRRADAAGKKITAVALHPGAVRTDLPRYIYGEDKFVSMQDAAPTFVDTLKALPAFYFTKNVRRGATTQIYLSSGQEKDDDVKGKFFFNMKDTKLLPAGLDMDKAKKLWEVSEDMSGTKFNL